MIVARYALGVCDIAIFDCRLQHHAFGQLIDHATLDFLPWRLALGKLVAAIVLQFSAPALDLVVGDENVGGALAQVDPHPVAIAQQRQPAADSGFRRGVEDRRAA
jgi:hypothetical protein